MKARSCTKNNIFATSRPSKERVSSCLIELEYGEESKADREKLIS